MFYIEINMSWPIAVNLLGPTGSTGMNGDSGESGNTFYSGSGAPYSTLGKIGDSYTDVDTGDLYAYGKVTTLYTGFNQGYALVRDLSGIVYVSDVADNVIKKIDLDGSITIIAGDINYYGNLDDDVGTDARLYQPYALALNSDESRLYFVNNQTHTIRYVELSGTYAVVTYAGDSGTTGDDDGDISSDPTEATFYSPMGIAIDPSDNIYISDSGNYTIRKISPEGVVTTLAGEAGTSAFVDGDALDVRFTGAHGIVYYDGFLYVVDTGAHRIRRVDVSTGDTLTVVGDGIAGIRDDINPLKARIDGVYNITSDGTGNLYFSDATFNIIRKFNLSGGVTTIAGSGTSGLANGQVFQAAFTSPAGLIVYSTDIIYVADVQNVAIRKINLSWVLNGSIKGATGNVGNSFYSGIGASGSAYYPAIVGDSYADVETGDVYAYGAVGTYITGQSTYGLAVASNGIIYTTNSSSIIQIDTSKNITVIAGSAETQGYSDNAVGLDAELSGDIKGLVLNENETMLYFCDTNNNAIRTVALSGDNPVSTLAGASDCALVIYIYVTLVITQYEKLTPVEKYQHWQG